MKKSLLALAVLGAFAGVASAQSSVTLFGVIDLAGRNVKNGSVDQYQMVNSGFNSSRLGFRGVEDLGGGLRAGFWLEGQIFADVGGGNNGATGGSVSTGAGALDFQRRSTVSLIGNWGEIRLGRDYTPGFWNTTIFDPFGTNGVGSFTNISVNPAGAAGNGMYVRANNSIGYHLPGNLGGFYGQVMFNAGENGAGGATKLKYAFRVGYAAGPINVAFSSQETDTIPDSWTHNNIAGSWNFGFMTLMAQYDTVELGVRDAKIYLIGVTVPMGQGQLNASYVSGDQSGGGFDANDADQFAIGYVYNLSKRTALYGTYSQLSNDGTGTLSVGALNGFAMPGGAKSTGYEIGVRHAF